MKTPRLFLLLAWALFAPVAHAAGYPTWTVENQSSREWPDVGFQVGKDWRTLRCRIAECNPHNKKGIVNLYQLVQVGAPSPIKATWTVVKQRNSWSPARLVGSTEYREEEEIDAVLMTYSAELSYYKLDLNTNPITVVQGTNRYPATTSVDRVEVSAPGNAIRVVPPSKMSDDEVKPKPPAAAPGTAPVTAPVTAPATPPKPKTTWWCNKQTGEFIGVKPGHRAPEGYTQLDSHSSTCKAAAGPTNPSQDVVTGWKDVVTPLTAWRQVMTTTKVVLYCYNPALTATDTLLSVANKPGPRSICVSWNVPSPDPVVDGYKARNFSGSYGALSVREGKLRVGTIPMKLFFMTMPSLDFGEVTEAPLDATAFEGATKVKVGDPQKPAAASTELSKKEITWLTKSQASDYDKALKALASKPEAERADATKALAADTRKLIVANMEPKEQSYKTAIAQADATVATIDASLPSMWGGDVKEVVKASGANTDIQLSVDEFKALGDDKYKAEMSVYQAEHAKNDGNVGSDAKPVFGLDNYDPIALHQTTMAARKAFPPATTTPDAPGAGLDPKNLTDDEMKLLTPSELKKYQAQLGFASEANASVETKNALQKMNAEYRARIAAGTDRVRKPYPAEAASPDFNQAKFDGLQDWQKRKFCEEHPNPVGALAGDQRAGEVINSPIAKKGLFATAKGAPPAAKTNSSGPSSWIANACKDYRTDQAPTIPDTGDITRRNSGIENIDGPDKENAGKKKNEWITQPLVTSAVQGALVGLLLGSLFPPVGFILGPMLGAALFYGVTKVTS